MSYDEYDARMDEAMDAFYEDIREEVYPELKEQAIGEFVKERMRSYFLQNPEIIQRPLECFFHAEECSTVSPSAAIVMFTTSIELYLKTILLKPVLYGMFHNESVAQLVVETTTKQSGFNRYQKLLTLLCDQAAGVNLSGIEQLNWQSLWKELHLNQEIRNKIIHQGYQSTTFETQNARNLAVKVLTRMVEPVLKRLDLGIDESNFHKEIITSL